jgi:hypothetical protein
MIAMVLDEMIVNLAWKEGIAVVHGGPPSSPQKTL